MKALLILNSSITEKQFDNIFIKPFAKPFLKWAGGKRALLKDIFNLMPKQYNKYYEPFIGGGALFFHLAPKNATISDANPELIDTYISIKKNLSEVIEKLDSHIYDKEYYYTQRAIDPNELSKVERAARMIFLNKTGFNGLYRVNNKGKFNVPFGRYINPKFYNMENLLKVRESLKDTTILNSTFEKILEKPQKNDFVYLDPPYIPISASSSFTAYMKNGFGMDNQETLAKTFEALDKRGCHIMLSNSDVPWIKERYQKFNIHKVTVKRHVNAKKSGRGKISELIVTNY